MTTLNGTGKAHTHRAHRLREEAGLAKHVHIGGCFLGECCPSTRIPKKKDIYLCTKHQLGNVLNKFYKLTEGNNEKYGLIMLSLFLSTGTRTPVPIKL